MGYIALLFSNLAVGDQLGTGPLANRQQKSFHQIRPGGAAFLAGAVERQPVILGWVQAVQGDLDGAVRALCVTENQD